MPEETAYIREQYTLYFQKIEEKLGWKSTILRLVWTIFSLMARNDDQTEKVQQKKSKFQ